jgi:cell division protein FtsI (penicillin-binding protein 3)
MYSVQISDTARWRRWANRQHLAEVKLAPERGPIYDRHGKLLAVSVPAGSIYVRPRSVKEQVKTAQILGKYLQKDPSQLLEKLQEKKPFVWVARQVPRALAEEISALKLAGVGHFLESKRYYPFNRAASEVIGLAGLDGNGLSGLELAYNTHLRGAEVETQVKRDALGKLIHLSATDESMELPKGEALSLTLDSDIQVIVDEELDAARDRTNAKHVFGLMIDSDTGEILALGQSPGLNFNVDRVESGRDLSNPIMESVFEPGSIMKPLVAGAAMDAGLFAPKTLINCEKGKYKVGRHTIKDVHPSAIISMHNVVVQSSNIGMSKIGLAMGKERLYNALSSFGFGELSGIGLSGESRGIVRHYSKWATVDMATHAFGQGIAVTPLQIVRAVAAVAADGVLPNLSLISGRAGPGTRVLSDRAARAVREMMYGVVEDEHGTGANAKIEGIRIGGKTGTAQKARKHGGGYEPGAYVASFVGFADGREVGLSQRFTLLVSVDEADSTSIYGGTLAAPVFKSIMQRSIQLLRTRSALRPGSYVNSSNGHPLVRAVNY